MHTQSVHIFNMCVFCPVIIVKMYECERFIQPAVVCLIFIVSVINVHTKEQC